MYRNIDRLDGLYYCINNGFDSGMNLVCNELYYLTNNGYYINIHSQDNRLIGTYQLSRWQNIDDYFMTQAEWLALHREEQIKSVLDD
jgi:hypothetical protein